MDVDMDKIFSGNDRALELGFRKYRDMMSALAARNNRAWSGKITDKKPVPAFVDNGRWLGLCECNNATFVDPADPLFYCPDCGNAITAGAARRVIFPDNRRDIERALLEREVDTVLPVLDSQTILMRGLCKPKHIDRSWMPGETVDDLQKQHKRSKKQKRR